MSNQNYPDEKVIVEAETTEAFLERRRYQDLFNAREEVVKRLRHRPELRSSEKRREELDEDLHAAVTSLVLEAEPLFRNTEVGRQLWSERVLGPVHISQAFPEAVDYANVTDMDTSRLPARVQIKDGQIRFRGIEPYAELTAGILTVKLEQSISSRNPHAKQEEKVRIETVPPKEVSAEAFRATNDLFSELDLMGKLGGEDYRADEPGA